MIFPTRRSTLALLLASVLPACAGEEVGNADGAGEAGQAAPAEAAPAPQTPTRAALPGLFTVMAGLEADMAKLSRGLWAEDWDTIGAGAGAVADHPKVPPEEAQEIAGVLGQEMGRFKAFDMEVHDLATRIQALAGEEQMDSILAIEAELRQGCAGCHTAFRERLRSAFR